MRIPGRRRPGRLDSTVATGESNRKPFLSHRKAMGIFESTNGGRLAHSGGRSPVDRSGLATADEFRCPICLGRTPGEGASNVARLARSLRDNPYAGSPALSCSARSGRVRRVNMSIPACAIIALIGECLDTTQRFTLLPSYATPSLKKSERYQTRKAA